MRGQPCHNTRPHGRLPFNFLDDLTAERSFDSQAMWVIDVLGLSFVVLSMGVCTTRHWQTSSQLVQELNVCAVCNGVFFIITMSFSFQTYSEDEF